METYSNVKEIDLEMNLTRLWSAKCALEKRWLASEIIEPYPEELRLLRGDIDLLLEELYQLKVYVVKKDNIDYIRVGDLADAEEFISTIPEFERYRYTIAHVGQSIDESFLDKLIDSRRPKGI